MQAIGLKPMHQRPPKGSRITVQMRDGSQLSDCCATMVYIADKSGIVIFHGKKAIDEQQAIGWWQKGGA